MSGENRSCLFCQLQVNTDCSLSGKVLPLPLGLSVLIISHENIRGKRAASEGAGLNMSGPAKRRRG